MQNKIAKIRSEKGTALIVALLIMGVLIAISLALASLIFKEVKVTRDLINAGKAYYMAEAGVEKALYYLNSNLPGWEALESWNPVGNGSDLKFKYEVKNTCSSYPCMDGANVDLTVIGLNTQEAFYDVLPLNQTITVPLFVVDTDPIIYQNTVKSINDFTVEYYAKFKAADLNSGLRVIGASGWDVLRWKIFGMKKYADDYVTESISDFVPVTILTNGVDTAAGTPSWFGTSKTACADKQNVYGIACYDYHTNWFSSATDTSQLCNNMSARDYYKYDSQVMDPVIRSCYSVQDFITEHVADPNNPSSQNTGLTYLTLTNMMNPSMFKTGTLKEREDKSDLYFRVELPENLGGDPPKIVREYADITADGVSGDTAQSINVKIKRNSYMPVFNFAIYSTYGKEDYYDY